MRPSIPIWDLPTRLFHWLTVSLVAAAYVTWRLNWMDWHAYAGEAVLALVIFRLAWGFVGSDTARFARFLASPRAAVAPSRPFVPPRARRRRSATIRPAAGWSCCCCCCCSAQTLTGIIDNNDVADAGPLTGIMPAPIANLVDDLHTWLWNALLAALALHLIAIALYAAAKGQNLLRPMLTGRKHLPETRCAAAACLTAAGAGS